MWRLISWVLWCSLVAWIDKCPLLTLTMFFPVTSLTCFQPLLCCLFIFILLAFAGSNTVHCQGSSILSKDMEYTLYTTSSSVLHISLLEEVLGWRFSLYGDFLVISFVNCTWRSHLIQQPSCLVPCYCTLESTIDYSAAVAHFFEHGASHPLASFR